MQLLEMLAPFGFPCRSGRQRTGFRGITVHNTSNYSNGAGALNHAKYLQNSGKNNYVSWHYVVDEDYAIRCIPENEVAWCAGDGNGDGNFKTINIEICDNPDGDIKAATDNAVFLCADILKRNGVTDARSYLFQHNYWTGKDCPYDIRRGNPYDWNTFINKVQKLLNGTSGGGVKTPDQILHIGSKVKFDGIFKVNVIKLPYSDNCFGNTACTGITSQEYKRGKCKSYHWIPLDDWTACDGNGNALENQIVKAGKSFVKNDNIYSVLAIDVPSDSAKININGRSVWIYCKQLYEVSDN